MKKSELTKIEIINNATRIIYYNGFHNTSLNELLRKCGVSKGKFYYYFKSKEDVLSEIIEVHTNTLLYVFEQAITEINKETITNFFTTYFENVKKNKFHGGAPLLNIAVEMADIDENIRKKIINSNLKLVNRIAVFIQLFRKIKIEEAEILADILLVNFEGTLNKMKIEKTEKPIKSFFYVFNKIIFEKE